MWRIHNDQFVDKFRVAKNERHRTKESKTSMHTGLLLPMQRYHPNHDQLKHTVDDLEYIHSEEWWFAEMFFFLTKLLDDISNITSQYGYFIITNTRRFLTETIAALINSNNPGKGIIDIKSISFDQFILPIISWKICHLISPRIPTFWKTMNEQHQWLIWCALWYIVKSYSRWLEH